MNLIDFEFHKNVHSNVFILLEQVKLRKKRNEPAVLLAELSDKLPMFVCPHDRTCFVPRRRKTHDETTSDSPHPEERRKGGRF